MKLSLLVISGLLASVVWAPACSSTTAGEEPSVIPPEPAPGAPDSGQDPACTGPQGCYSCEPAAPEQFLNRCADGACLPFDDKARLPLLGNGELPPVP